jgi:hypothetical protein
MAQLSSIEDKKNKSQEKKAKKMGWDVFFISVLRIAIYVLIWAFLSSNVLYFMYVNLDWWFPSNENEAPYTKTSPAPQAGGSSDNTNTKPKQQSVSDCLNEFANTIIDNNKIKTKINNLLGFDKVGFPYSKITSDTGSDLGSYFGRSAKSSFATCRNMMKNVVNFLKINAADKPRILFLISLPIILVTILAQIVIGYFTTIWKQLNVSLLKTILFLFVFGISIIWPTAVGFAQGLQLLFIFAILPMMFDSEMIIQIIRCNASLIANVFSLLVIRSAFNTLDPVIGICMLIGWLINLFINRKKN